MSAHTRASAQNTGAGAPLWEPTMHDVLQAQRRLAPYLEPTPCLRADALGRALGCTAYVKCENLQPSGAFKVRGGINLVAALHEAGALNPAGMATASTGNHGQSIAYAVRLFGVPATIFAPQGANPLKVAAMKALGAVFLRGFSEAIGIAVARVAVYLTLNLVVIVAGLVHVARHAHVVAAWQSALAHQEL